MVPFRIAFCLPTATSFPPPVGTHQDAYWNLPQSCLSMIYTIRRWLRRRKKIQKYQTVLSSGSDIYTVSLIVMFALRCAMGFEGGNHFPVIYNVYTKHLFQNGMVPPTTSIVISVVFYTCIIDIKLSELIRPLVCMSSSSYIIIRWRSMFSRLLASKTSGLSWSIASIMAALFEEYLGMQQFRLEDVLLSRTITWRS